MYVGGVYRLGKLVKYMYVGGVCWWSGVWIQVAYAHRGGRHSGGGRAGQCGVKAGIITSCYKSNTRLQVFIHISLINTKSCRHASLKQDTTRLLCERETAIKSDKYVQPHY